MKKILITIALVAMALYMSGCLDWDSHGNIIRQNEIEQPEVD